MPLPLSLPCLILLYLSASSFRLSFAFWARQVLPLFDSHPLGVRLVTSSSPACLSAWLPALCLSSGFIVSTGDYKYRPCAPGSSSVHRATSIATFCLCSGCHAQYSPRQLTKVVQKKQKGRARTRRRARRSTRTTHTLTSSLQFRWDRHICYCRC